MCKCSAETTVNDTFSSFSCKSLCDRRICAANFAWSCNINSFEWSLMKTASKIFNSYKLHYGCSNTWAAAAFWDSVWKWMKSAYLRSRVCSSRCRRRACTRTCRCSGRHRHCTAGVTRSGRRRTLADTCSEPSRCSSPAKWEHTRSCIIIISH